MSRRMKKLAYSSMRVSPGDKVSCIRMGHPSKGCRMEFEALQVLDADLHIGVVVKPGQHFRANHEVSRFPKLNQVEFKAASISGLSAMWTSGRSSLTRRPPQGHGLRFLGHRPLKRPQTGPRSQRHMGKACLWSFDVHLPVPVAKHRGDVLEDRIGRLDGKRHEPLKSLELLASDASQSLL